MNARLLSAALAAAIGVSPAFADPLGVWTVTSESAVGPSVSTMTVTEAGGAYALTYESDAGDSAISNLHVDGDHVTFVRTLSGTALGSDIVFNYDITIEGDALSGIAEVTGDAAQFIGDSIELEGARQ